MASAASFNLMLGFFWIKFPMASWMSIHPKTWPIKPSKQVDCMEAMISVVSGGLLI